jgi:predicted RNase H-like nuclease (RuvC/YqgF family)
MAEPTLKEVLDAIAQMQGEMATRADLARVEGKVDKLDGKVDKLDGRVDKLDGRVDKLDGRVDKLEAKLDTLEAKVAAHRAETAKSFLELDRESQAMQMSIASLRRTSLR